MPETLPGGKSVETDSNPPEQVDRGLNPWRNGRQNYCSHPKPQACHQRIQRRQQFVRRTIVEQGVIGNRDRPALFQVLNFGVIARFGFLRSQRAFVASGQPLVTQRA